MSQRPGNMNIVNLSSGSLAQDRIAEAARRYAAPVLYRDQRQLVEDAKIALRLFCARNRLMVQAETGFGKSPTAATWAVEMLAANPDAVIGWMTNGEELKEQAAKEMTRCGAQIADFAKQASLREWQPGAVTVFSPTTVTPAPPPNSILFIDEAHHSLAPTWRKKIESGWAIVIGFTATPWVLSKSADFREVWDHLVCGPAYCDLRTRGRLADFKIVYPSHGAVIQHRVLRKDTSGEYDDETVTAEVLRVLATDSAVAEWAQATKSLKDRRTILFAPTVPSAEQAAEQFAARGISAAVLHAKTPRAERKAMVADFRAGKLTVLANVSVATEGFDCPSAAVVVIMRPTASLGLHRQMLGRVLRPAANKDRAIILDLAGNCLQHGGPDRKMDWSLSPRCTERRRAGVAYGACPHGCMSVNHVSANECRECSGRLRFECGACRRKLSFGSYTNSRVSGSSCHVPDGAECDECQDRRKTERQRLVDRAHRSFGYQRWKEHRRHDGKAEWQLQTSKQMASCPWSVGTRLVFDGSEVVAYAVASERDYCEQAGGTKTKHTYHPIAAIRNVSDWSNIAVSTQMLFEKAELSAA